MIVIIGAGDHALETYDILKDIYKVSNDIEEIYFFDEDTYKHGAKHGDSIIINLFGLNNKIRGVLGVGTPHREFIDRCRYYVGEWLTVIHPKAQLCGNITLGIGNIVRQGVIMMPYSKLEDFVQLNVNALIGHHVEVGAYTCIGPGAQIMGRVQIGKECYIGVGSIILQKLKIADRVTIGAGAVVIKNIDEPNTTWVGNPARKLQKR